MQKMRDDFYRDQINRKRHRGCCLPASVVQKTQLLIGILTGLQSNAATTLIAWETGSLPHMASGTY